jgi:hypothetical protein
MIIERSHREAELRRVARRQGLVLQKSRARNLRIENLCGYRLLWRVGCGSSLTRLLERWPR